MTITAQFQLGDLLEHVADTLDISESVHEEAVRKYEELGHWLEEEDKKNGRREPRVYPQGSFRLGTVIRPISDKDEYDIDLVYERELRKGSVSQKQLKEEAGEHLTSFVEHCRESYRSAPKLIEGCRCWRLEYPDRFHMDVLPAIPDVEGRRKQTLFCETAIHITDRDVKQWQFSNPIGYAEWFKGRMRKQFDERRLELGRALLEAKGQRLTEFAVKEAAEQVPDYKVKTALQRAIQILKRHRDYYFQDDKDHRPVSIILTTLGAQAYGNENNLVDALLNLVRRMPEYIMFREVNGKRVSWVPNPVNQDENFADRWQDPEYPRREEVFRSWLQKVNEDLAAALRGGGLHKVIELLGSSLGRPLVEKAATTVGQRTLQERQDGNLRMATGTGLLGTAGSIKVKEHTFYGLDRESKNQSGRSGGAAP